MCKYKVMLSLMIKWAVFALLIIGYPVLALEDVTYKDGIYHAPLSAFTGNPEPIRLRGNNPAYTLNIPISDRLEIKKAELLLHYDNSVSLNEGSHINVLFNEYSLSQLPSSSSSTNNKAKIKLPVKNITAGYHSLKFSAAQQYSNGCENGDSSKLWSDIRTDESSLMFEAKLKKLDPLLSDLPMLFDKRLWEYNRLSIAAPSSLNQTVLFESGSLASQGAGLLFDYSPIGISQYTLQSNSGKERDTQARTSVFSGVNFSSIPEGDVLILGTRNTLVPFLRQDELNRINEGYYAIYPRPDDHTRFVFLIAGNTESDLKDATKAFAHGKLLLPYSNRSSLRNVNIPPVNEDSANGTLLPNGGKKHTFDEFSFKTTTLKGMGSPSKNLIFWTQPDPFAPLKDTLDLRLNVSYSGGMNADSILNIMLNERYESGLVLASEQGGRHENAKLSIPYAHLKPGWNSLNFIADVKPLFMGGDCQPIIDSHLNVTIFENSTIALNTRGDVSTLPDLELLRFTGKPLVNSKDGKDLKVVLANASPGTLSASWTLLAKIAQLNRHALTSAQYSLNPNDALKEDNKYTLLIGVDTAIPQAIAEHAQFSSLNNSHQSPLIQEHSELTGSVSNGFSGLLPESWQRWLGITQQKRLQKIYASTQITADFQKESALLLMRSPVQKNKSLTIITGSNSEKLAADMNALVQFEPWSKLSGDTVLWSADSKYPGLVRSARISKPIDEDSIGIQRSIGFYFTQHPWFFIFIVLLILGLAVVATHIALTKRQLARQQTPQD